MPKRGGTTKLGITVRGTEDIIAYQRKLETLGGTGPGSIADAFEKELRKIANLIIDELKREARKIPDQSPARRADGKSYRTELAQAFTYRISERGLYVFVDRSKLPEGAKALPYSFERAQFRHPVYGNRSVWVTQKGHPFIQVTLAKYEAIAARRLQDVLDGIGR